MPLPQTATTSQSTGARLVSTDGRVLPYRGAELSVDARGGLARVTLRQVFHNPYDEPLRLHYSLPLPADAAVAGFAFELGERRIVGEVDTRRKARERFEEALVEGRSAALLEQERSSVFTQELGNVPPKTRIVCEVQLDQVLSWRADGTWEWRFPTVIGPRFMGEPGRVPDADAVSVDVDADGTAPRATLSLRVRDALTGAATSPSHVLHSLGGEISLQAEDGAALDRDLVVRWPVAAPTPGLSLDRARPAVDRDIAAHAHGLLTIVPPDLAHQGPAVGRDLVVLLDTSGSMHGEPIAQAKAVTVALIQSLGEGDSLQLVEFSTRPRSWKKGAKAVDDRVKEQAIAWVEGLSAGGGTQMKDGILAALDTLRGEAQRQVVLITDGLIGFEREIVGTIATKLPRGSRVHALGIGSSVNRSLTGGVARAGGGVEAIVGLGEAPDSAAKQLVAATARPLVVDLELSGDAVVDAAHHRLPDLYAGRPARIALRLRPQGGRLVLRGHGASGAWEQVLDVAPTQPGSGSPAIVTLVGREQVEELELAAARGEQVDARIEQLGLAYQVATRLTSWVAVSQQQDVDATAPTRSERIPQALPHGMSVEGLGLRSPQPMMRHAAMAAPPMAVASRSMPRKRKSLVAFRFSPGEAESFSGGRGGAADDEAPAGPPMEAEESIDFMGTPAPTGAPLPSTHLPGRLLLHKDGRLVLELTILARMPWRPGLRARLLLADGSHRTVQIDLTGTTAEAQLGRGSTARLVLHCEALPADLVSVELDNGTIVDL